MSSTDFLFNAAKRLHQAVRFLLGRPALQASVALAIVFSGPAGAIDIDGDGKHEIIVRSNDGRMQLGRLVNNNLQFSITADPGPAHRVLGIADFNGNGRPELAFQNMSQGAFGDVRVWPNFVNSNGEILWRQVKQVWDVQAVGDLDGDGFADLVWRYVVSDSPDTGVSYIWFTNGSGVTQVRKRGGAPLDWRMLGAIDLNNDGAADMVYLSPQNQLRVLMATPNRTCANLTGGTLPAGYSPLSLADFTGNRRGEILLRNSAGAAQLLSLNASGLTLPAYTGAPDDQNASCTASALSVSAASITLPTTDPSWQFYAAADLNGDGLSDIVWRQLNGALVIWLLNRNGAPPTVVSSGGVAPDGFNVFQSGTVAALPTASTLLIRAWNPDGTEASIGDFVTHTRYITSRWSMYSNYGVFAIGQPPATAQIGTDIYSTAVDNVNYVAMNVPTNKRFYFTALWKAPVIGTVFMRADNAGAGFVVSGTQVQRLELPYDFALAEYQQAQRLLTSEPLTPEAQELLSRATAAIDTARSAPTAATRAVAAYSALSFVMPLKERLVLDASNKLIAKNGRRADFDLNYEGFGSWTDNAHVPGYVKAKEAGFKSVLTNVEWEKISPARGRYDFSTLDYQIQQAERLGFKVALILNRNPNGAAPWMRNLSFSELKTLFYENARLVVTRYGSRVAWYYPAGELELERAGFTIEQVSELAKQSLDGAKAAAPSMAFGIYVSGSAYVSYQMNVTSNPSYLSGLELIRQLLKDNVKFDFIGLQMQYGTTFAPIDIQRFQEILLDYYKVANIPIYMGETGYSSKGEDYGDRSQFFWRGGLTQQVQYEWADATLRTLYAMPFVKGYYWVHLDPDNFDYGSDYLSSLLGTGILRADGAVKKVYSAFKNFTDQLAATPPNGN